jgi:hypothetical protein
MTKLRVLVLYFFLTLWITLMVIKNNEHILLVMFMRLKILYFKIFKVCSSKLMVENLQIHYFIIVYKFFWHK